MPGVQGAQAPGVPSDLIGSRQGVKFAPSSAAVFAFNPARTAASVTLSLANTRATATLPMTYATAFGTAAVDTTKTYAFTITNNTLNGQAIGAGNSSADLNNILGIDANSLNLLFNGDVYVNSILLASTGLSNTTGDVMRMRFTATQVQFSKNGGSFSSLITHGVSGTLFPGATVYNTLDAITGAIE